MGTVADVVVTRPIPGPLTYEIPKSLEGTIQLGSVVEVPFRSEKVIGFVVKVEERPTALDYEIKSIEKKIIDEPIFNERDFKFYQWVSNYYQLPLGEVFHSAYPKIVFAVPKKKKQKNLEKIFNGSFQIQYELTLDQKLSLAKIRQSIDEKKYKSYLLFGVTGSGKTEVYIQAAQYAMLSHRSALILVPEIALTPQLRVRFEERFGDEVAVLHSGLTSKARREYWWDILHSKRRIVVGARSAIFAPIRNLGLVVVDEEHEASYKQEDRLRYHARDLALVRAMQGEAVTILGSATPSIETFYAAKKGKHELLTLHSRPNFRPLPQIEVVDLKQSIESQKEKRKNEQKYEFNYHQYLFSEKLVDGIKQTIDQGEQAIIFVNRKGFSNFLMCQDCGYVLKCPNCSVSLTYYKASSKVRCHYCCFEKETPRKCFQCKSEQIKFMGFGTELAEQELKVMFPGVVVDRLDADRVRNPKELEDVLNNFRDGKIQILVGTQMLAKGHDFPNVTFIGVLLADMSLHLPDFRSGERTFQLMAQVSGRAGRAEKPGRVVLQTFIPDHYVIQAVSDHNYELFFEKEIELRKDFGYPPFFKIAQVEFRHLNEKKAQRQAQDASVRLQAMENQDLEGLSFQYLGPAPASILKIANQYRYQILLKSEKSTDLNSVIKTLRKLGTRFIDVDPVNTL